MVKLVLTEVQRNLLNRTDRIGRIGTEAYRGLPGVHFCPDWDYLAICDASPEKSGCTCAPTPPRKGEQP